jgi:ribonuclease HII
VYSYEIKEMCIFENHACLGGFLRIGGIDEAGRGALAGPVVAACVILDEGKIPSGIVDSKKISDRKRRELYGKIVESALSIGVGVVESEVIDRVNIYNATKMAMKSAVERMKVKPDFLLIDALKLNDISISTLSIIKGEEKSVSIAAASIVAKVCRDDIMISLSTRYPQYRFDLHKGYGTLLHNEKLIKFGPSKVHRYSYKPVAIVRDIWKLKEQR